MHAKFNEFSYIFMSLNIRLNWENNKNSFHFIWALINSVQFRAYLWVERVFFLLVTASEGEVKYEVVPQ